MAELRPYAILDRRSRIKKANTIIKILESKIPNLQDKKILEVGTGSGYMASEFGKVSAEVYSVDVKDVRKSESGYIFKQVASAGLPFEKETFDIVISNHVIEHIPNQLQHITEVRRVLKKGGILYLATPNKFWITDPHTKLPFITWFGRTVADGYSLLFGKGHWDVFPVSYRFLNNSLSSGFDLKFMSPDIIKFNKKYRFPLPRSVKLIIDRIPRSVIALFTRFGPTYNFLCVKR